MATVSLDSEVIEQLGGEQKALLDAIDSLRKHGIGRFVDLPQIIVVGDQSSGKSSVLEAISRVRFPVQDGLCTRFATELVLRTDSQTRVDVRIQSNIVSPKGKDPYTFNQSGFSKEDLPRIIEKAKSHLLVNSATFSEDVLRVEICSPDVPHLTLVDLPGFYHSEDENQDAAGRRLVEKLAEGYMKRKTSIILAIVSARNQVILQTVLSRVKQFDKTQERTLGIITKPDLLTSQSQDEDRFLRLARNQDKFHRLSLGWHVLRNRGETEDAFSSEERDDREETFFESGVWSGIPSNNRGVGTLRVKLAQILLDHIRQNLHTLIQSIEKSMVDRQTRLRQLGDSRSTPRQLRGHMDKLAGQFQLLSLHAIEGNYSDDFFGGLYPDSITAPLALSRVKRLRALVRDLNRTFAYVLATKGSRRKIVDDEDSDEDSDEDIPGKVLSLPPYLRALESQYRFKEPEEVTRNHVASELEPLSSANQGNEFPGTANDRLAVKLFQDQSRPWEGIAKFHITILLRTAKLFVGTLVEHLTASDSKTCSAILTSIVDPFFEERKSALETKLQELLYHFKSGYPQPLDADFRAALGKRNRKRLTAEVVQQLLDDRPELFTDEGKILLRNSTSTQQPSEFGVESLIDKCETYYELCLRTFTDNMIVLAIENCLVNELPTILTTSRVSQMEDDELIKLAAESTDIQTERTELQAEYEALKQGLDLCKSYKARKPPAIPILGDHLAAHGNDSRDTIEALFGELNVHEEEKPAGTSPGTSTINATPSASTGEGRLPPKNQLKSVLSQDSASSTGSFSPKQLAPQRGKVDYSVTQGFSSYSAQTSPFANLGTPQKGSGGGLFATPSTSAASPAFGSTSSVFGGPSSTSSTPKNSPFGSVPPTIGTGNIFRDVRGPSPFGRNAATS
ncbi:P-loop containing nucleoside triphosphate hydrolase protein [Xylariaceae sp. FL1019]|nr:P-loop containing nucleoside triphosphate hydrolase protein [Xylariaceae sp. FL1019]